MSPFFLKHSFLDRCVQKDDKFFHHTLFGIAIGIALAAIVPRIFYILADYHVVHIRSSEAYLISFVVAAGCLTIGSLVGNIVSFAFGVSQKIQLRAFFGLYSGYLLVLRDAPNRQREERVGT